MSLKETKKLSNLLLRSIKCKLFVFGRQHITKSKKSYTIGEELLKPCMMCFLLITKFHISFIFWKKRVTQFSESGICFLAGRRDQNRHLSIFMYHINIKILFLTFSLITSIIFVLNTYWCNTKKLLFFLLIRRFLHQNFNSTKNEKNTIHILILSTIILLI